MNKKVRIRVHSKSRSGVGILLGLALLTASLLVYFALSGQEASASVSDAPLASTANMRHFYLTGTLVNGANAKTACADGYHMASLWEILDTSKLKYDTAIGFTKADSGEGAPSFNMGWVRTGYDSSNFAAAGLGNCNAWDSDVGTDYGTYANLPRDWMAGTDVYTWEVDTAPCSSVVQVWCVQDYVDYTYFMPTILQGDIP